MASMSLAFQPAASSAFWAAWSARSEAPTPGVTQRRSLMPVRWVIHSSLVSMSRVSSSLVTTRSGTAVPSAAMTVRGMRRAPSLARPLRDPSSDVEVLHVQRVALDELPARVHRVAHQDGEDLIGLHRVVHPDLEERAPRRVHGRLPELLGVHLAEPLVALDALPLAGRPLQPLDHPEDVVHVLDALRRLEAEGARAELRQRGVQGGELPPLGAGEVVEVEARVARRAGDVGLVGERVAAVLLVPLDLGEADLEVRVQLLRLLVDLLHLRLHLVVVAEELQIEVAQLDGRVDDAAVDAAVHPREDGAVGDGVARQLRQIGPRDDQV